MVGIDKYQEYYDDEHRYRLCVDIGFSGHIDIDIDALTGSGGVMDTASFRLEDKQQIKSIVGQLSLWLAYNSD